jgi:hypothetical protein
MCGEPELKASTMCGEPELKASTMSGEPELKASNLCISGHFRAVLMPLVWAGGLCFMVYSCMGFACAGALAITLAWALRVLVLCSAVLSGAGAQH